MIDVVSTAIRQIDYDEFSRELVVTFVSGRSYTYYFVPREIYLQFFGAESKGQYFNEHIRDRYRYAENNR